MKKLWRIFTTYFGTIFVPLVACALMVSALISGFRVTSNLDYEVYDIFQNMSADGKHSDLPIIVDIDEKSLERYGQWPWPRYILSNLLLSLSQNGVSAIGLDILFSEKDRSSPSLVSTELKERFGIDFNVSVLPKELQNNDENFAFVLKNTPVVLGSFAFFDGDSRRVN